MMSAEPTAPASTTVNVLVRPTRTRNCRADGSGDGCPHLDRGLEQRVVDHVGDLLAGLGVLELDVDVQTIALGTLDARDALDRRDELVRILGRDVAELHPDASLAVPDLGGTAGQDNWCESHGNSICRQQC